MRAVLTVLMGAALVGPICHLTAQTAAPSDNPLKGPLTNADIKAEQSDAEIILLANLPSPGEAGKIISFARKNYIYTDLILDPALQQMTRMALTKIEENPSNSQKIRADHLFNVSNHFLKQAMDGYEKHLGMADVLNLAQISVRCQPANSKAKLFYSNVLHSNLGRTDDAIQTLQHGLDFLDANDPLAKDYVERYFQLLQLRERDGEVIEQGFKLLKSSRSLPASVTPAVSLAVATSLYWVGRYQDCVAMIEAGRMEEQASGLLLKARALFDGGKTKEAISLLEKRTADHKGAARDAILSQSVRFHMLLGQHRYALSVSEDRISAQPRAPFPRLQKLHALDRLRLKKEYESELALILEKFSDNAPAMIALANFAAERGYDGLTLEVANRSSAQGFEKATFAALHLEALINAKGYDQVIVQHRQIQAADSSFFKSKAPLVQALLGIAYHGRPKKDAADIKRDREIGDRYLLEFMKAPDLGPEAYRSVGRHLRAIRAAEAAVRVLEAGCKVHDRHSQLSADLISARILAGYDDAFGGRKSLADEIEALLKMRRPSPLVWQECLGWLRSESRLADDRRLRLEREIFPLTRPNLDQEALAGR